MDTWPKTCQEQWYFVCSQCCFRLRTQRRVAKCWTATGSTEPESPLFAANKYNATFGYPSPGVKAFPIIPLLQHSSIPEKRCERVPACRACVASKAAENNELGLNRSFMDTGPKHDFVEEIKACPPPPSPVRKCLLFRACP